MRYLRFWLLTGLVALHGAGAWAQTTATATLSGLVRAADGGAALEQVVIGVVGTGVGTLTDGAGAYRFRVPAGRPLTIEARRIGYLPLRQSIAVLAPGEARTLAFTLVPDAQRLGDATVRGRNGASDVREQASLMRIDPKVVSTLPTPFGEFNRVLATLPGVQATNELSSTYNVRGGNFDENLVYVNGMEVYRPFLVTSGQQEGLSFINPDLVEKIEFSAGGWQPKYGDKLSSVLAVDYKRPTAFAASAQASLTGGTAHLEAPSKNGRLTYLGGVRYKDSRYVLNALPTQGTYFPRFFDAQAYITANIGPKENPGRTTLGFLGNYARNNYRFEPGIQETSFGTINSVTRLTVYYDGREQMRYDTWQGSLNLRHQFTENLSGELIGSYVRSDEREFRDTDAQYFLAEVNTNPDSRDFNSKVRERAVGSQFLHSRNVLRARLATLDARTTWTPTASHTFRAGLKGGRERITDELQEYSFLDSADYVIRPTALFTTLRLPSERIQGYAQHTVDLDSGRTLTYGVRAHYWSFSGQTVVSPRVQYSWRAHRRKAVTYRVAAGLYQQPPFYRELRDNTGFLNQNIRAQRSYHLIGSSIYEFKQWGRPFQLTLDGYVKYLTDVIPYNVDNVRLRYFARNNATAYAVGFDARLNGEFIKGTESWFSLSVLTTREKIDQPGAGYPTRYIRRPTDQRLQLGAMFQDHLPGNPSVQLNFFNVIGTGLPFSPPEVPAFRGTSALTRLYWRTDIGFSKLIEFTKGTAAVRLRSLRLSAEVLNLLGKNNLVSYNYVQDVNGFTYAVPNYLSQRLLNVRLMAQF